MSDSMESVIWRFAQALSWARDNGRRHVSTFYIGKNIHSLVVAELEYCSARFPELKIPEANLEKNPGPYLGRLFGCQVWLHEDPDHFSLL